MRIKVDDSLSQLFRSDTPEFKPFEEDGVDLDAVEIGGLCASGRPLISCHDVGHLFDVQGARPYERNKFIFRRAHSR